MYNMTSIPRKVSFCVLWKRKPIQMRLGVLQPTGEEKLSIVYYYDLSYRVTCHYYHIPNNLLACLLNAPSNNALVNMSATISAVAMYSTFINPSKHSDFTK